MSLLGTPLLLLLGVLSLAMAPLIVLAWPRVHGKQWLRGIQRGGVVLLAQLMALCFGFVALNDYGQFFTTWGDLLGTGSTPKVVAVRYFGVHHRHHPGALPTATGQFRNLRPVSGSLGTTAGGASAVQPTAWAAHNQWAQRGEVVSMPIGGPQTGLSEPALVYLPPSWFTGDRRLPVVEVFSGYPGSSLGLVDRLDYPDLLLRGIASGAARPMVLVLLRSAVTYPRDTECTNVPGGPQVLSYFANDVPAVVDRTFGLQPPAYAAMGESTGGLCATKLALMDPNRFPAAVSMSGYYNAVSDFTTGKLYGDSARTRQLNDPSWRLTHLPPPKVSLLVATSKTEVGADGYATAQKFLSLVRPPMSATELVLNHGGHNFRAWVAEIPSGLHWLSQHFRVLARHATNPANAANTTNPANHANTATGASRRA